MKSYQDYVIKDGEFIGEFEQMYKDCDDPWEQSTRESNASEKLIALHLLKKSGAKKVIELGCGHGHFTEKIRKQNIEVIGIDISETAIEKARKLYPQGKFAVGDITDKFIVDFKPDVIVMAEITWYVLDQLDTFLKMLKTKLPDTKLLHLLVTYPEDVQKYGREKFTDLKQILRYFNLEYSEWGEISYPEMGGCKRTYFFSK